MDLITTHIGADFDALASMVAARRLHPSAKLFFPGSREESVRRMLTAGVFELEEIKRRKIDPQRIDTVILCDIRQIDRIGVVGDWLQQRPEIRRIAYDHHPDSDTDVEVGGGRVDAGVGATSTLMAELLREAGEPLSPEESTLLLMGIYEDTGALTFPTVSRRDLEAAGWLLEQGGDLAAVRRFALRRLDAPHLEILHRMTRALEVHSIRGHTVGIAALDLGGYVDELAPLVSRCLEIFELPLLFAVFGEGERVAIIARGDVPGVDLGRILTEAADGGGHATAAAARLGGATVIEASQRLLRHLEAALPPAALARDLMVTDYRTVSVGTSIREAKDKINRWKVNALPVIDADNRTVGALTRQILDGALQHEMEDREVATVMDSSLEWVEPTAAAEEIAARMTSLHPRFVLVGDAELGVAEGLVTRMQVLRHLHGKLEEAGAPLARRLEERRRQRRKIAGLLEQRLPEAMRLRLDEISAVARRHRIRVYLVGGVVRDLLLGKPNRDLDLVVEGDGPHFARLLIEAVGGRVRVHDAFMTAVCILEDGFRIDVATARSEFYRAPAALPEVQTSALRQDLYRRDFTINTLAIRLGPEAEPLLIDHFGGRRDLRRGALRVLHSLSFIDDPTRVLRAVRLESRLGFEISVETLRLVRLALREGVFDRLSGSRLRDELVLLLDDPMTVEQSVERLAELDLIGVLHPSLAVRWDADARVRLRRSVAAWDWYRLEGLTRLAPRVWRLILMTLCLQLKGVDLRGLVERLNLVGEDREAMLGYRLRLRRGWGVLRQDEVREHRVVEVLEGLRAEEVLLLMAMGDRRVRSRVRTALVELIGLELTIGGRDLVARGVESGPQIGRALRATRAARIDGEIEPEEELGYALAVLDEIQPEPASSDSGESPG